MWRVRARRPLGPLYGNGIHIPVGAPWSAVEPTRFEGGEFDVPEQWPLEEVRLDLFLGGEALVILEFEDGRRHPLGHDRHHRSHALRGRRGRISASAVPRGLLGSPVADPRLESACLTWLDVVVERFIRRVTLVRLAAEALDGHEVVDPLLDAAEAALGGIDLPTASRAYLGRFAERPETDTDYQLPSFTWSMPEDVRSDAPLSDRQRRSIETADTSLLARLRGLQSRYPSVGRVTVTGHAHIDLAWLWPMDETWQKVRRSFSTATDLIERYPDFRFAHSTAAVYQRLEQDDPELHARITGLVRVGAWQPTGGMWVEPDTILPTGESLIRQGLYGQRYFERTFGKTCRVAWIPDSFGFSAALPQILREVGMDSLFTAKLYWSETNVFPHSTFRWSGIDGSEITVHALRDERPGYNGRAGYNGRVTPGEVLLAWRFHAEKHLHPEALQPAGFGDGGGGPTIDMIEAVDMLRDMPVLPQTSFGHPEEFFDRLRESSEPHALPVWSGEMYLEFHRGTLTSQGRTKRLHRRAEQRLIQTEALRSFATLLGEAPSTSMETDWQVLMQNQFHDILPGTGIGQVHRQAERELVELQERLDARAAEALESIAGLIGAPQGDTAALVVNVEAQSQGVRLTSRRPLPGWQDAGDEFVFAGDEPAEPFSISRIPFIPPQTPVQAGDDWLENGFVRVKIAPNGQLSSILDKRTGREVLDGAGNQLLAYTDRPRTFDAWDIEHDYRRQGRVLELIGRPRRVENGPYRAAIRMTFAIGDSRVEQTVRLWSNSPRIEFHTRIDWHDRKLLLKARFPLAVRSSSAICECACGVISRPTHANTTWEAARFEVSGHRFVGLGEPGFGIALLNDGRYGHRITESELELTLLRSPAWPDYLADEGEQELVYALLPHPGAWYDAGVLAEAIELNRPLAFGTTTAQCPPMTLLHQRGTQVALGAIKPAEDGRGLVLRVYEPIGARGPCDWKMGVDGWRLTECVDALERPVSHPAGILPFQIRSWRLERAKAETQK